MPARRSILKSPAANKLVALYGAWMMLGAMLLGLFTDDIGFEFLKLTYRTGSQEALHPLAAVKLKGPNGGKLLLGYKTKRASVLLGLYFRDDGYVLIPEAQPDTYYALPKERKELQAQGELPSPLPAYRIPLAQYVLGYSAWWMTLLFVIIVTVSHLRRRRGQPAGD